MTLSPAEPYITLGDLRQELGQIFAIPVQRIRVMFQGVVLKDDRITLLEYGLETGARVTLLVIEAPKAHTAQHEHELAAEPLEAAPPVSQSFAPGTTENVGAGLAPEANAAPPAVTPPQLSPEERDMQKIHEVVSYCHNELLQELEQFEQTAAALPSVQRGDQADQSPDAPPPAEHLIPPSRIPITQRKLSELFLRQLLELDSIQPESEQIRSERKATVKEIQSFLERVDAAWNMAVKQKGIVSDV